MNPWTEESKNKLRATITAKMLGKTRIADRRGIQYIQERTENGWEYQHRVVMRRLLGRALLSSEIVHHLNHNTLDNRSFDLQLTTKRQHNLTHAPHRDVSHLVAAAKAKRLDGRWSLKFERCAACRGSTVPHAAKGLCRNCYGKAKGYGRKKKT